MENGGVRTVALTILQGYAMSGDQLVPTTPPRIALRCTVQETGDGFMGIQVIDKQEIAPQSLWVDLLDLPVVLRRNLTAPNFSGWSTLEITFEQVEDGVSLQGIWFAGKAVPLYASKDDIRRAA